MTRLVPGVLGLGYVSPPAGGSGTALMMVFAYVFTPLRVMVGFRA